ncbi:DUF4357 domain-containing protein [Candidatus Latescibacterota bacterium]
MNTIEIDFDVFKELTIRRKTEEITYNAVLREILGLVPITSQSAPEYSENNKPWICKGVTFPHNTEFRSFYQGEYYYGKADNGFMVVNGIKFKSPSPAAREITNNSVNGWVFWECKFPGDSSWVIMKKLRKYK